MLHALQYFTVLYILHSGSAILYDFFFLNVEPSHDSESCEKTVLPITLTDEGLTTVQ